MSRATKYDRETRKEKKNAASRRKKNTQSITELAVAARAAGMTYGQYVAQLEFGRMEHSRKDKIDVEELYKTDLEFRGYVRRYAKHRGIGPEEAVKHAIVRSYAEDLVGQNK